MKLQEVSVFQLARVNFPNHLHGANVREKTHVCASELYVGFPKCPYCRAPTECSSIRSVSAPGDMR